MIWIEIVCDGCMYTPFGESYRKGSVSKLKKDAKNANWKEVDGKIYCPECYKKMKRKAKED